MNEKLEKKIDEILKSKNQIEEVYISDFDFEIEQTKVHGLLTEQRVFTVNTNTSVVIRKEKNHKTPHVHLYINKESVASISIESSKIIKGEINKKIADKIIPWITLNKSVLQKLWDDLNNGDYIQLSDYNFKKE